jgi:hypothetical protein
MIRPRYRECRHTALTRGGPGLCFPYGIGRASWGAVRSQCVVGQRRAIHELASFDLAAGLCSLLRASTRAR